MSRLLALVVPIKLATVGSLSVCVLLAPVPCESHPACLGWCPASTSDTLSVTSRSPGVAQLTPCLPAGIADQVWLSSQPAGGGLEDWFIKWARGGCWTSSACLSCHAESILLDGGGCGVHAHLQSLTAEAAGGHQAVHLCLTSIRGLVASFPTRL